MITIISGYYLIIIFTKDLSQRAPVVLSSCCKWLLKLLYLKNHLIVFLYFTNIFYSNLWYVQIGDRDAFRDVDFEVCKRRVVLEGDAMQASIVRHAAIAGVVPARDRIARFVTESLKKLRIMNVCRLIIISVIQLSGGHCILILWYFTC